MCVDISNRQTDCANFRKEHGHKKFIIGYKIVYVTNNRFYGMYNNYYEYRPCWNQARNFHPIGVGNIDVNINDVYHPFSPAGIHVFFDKTMAIMIENVSLIYSNDYKCGFKLIEVKCYIKDFMLCDQQQAAFTRVWIDEDQFTVPW